MVHAQPWRHPWIGSRTGRWALSFATVAACAAIGIWPVHDSPARASATTPADADSARAALMRMSRALASARSFSVDATRQVDAGLLEGRGLPDSAAIHIEVLRPDHLHVVSRRADGERHFYFDGHSVTVWDAAKRLYAVTPMAGSIDDMIRALDERYGFLPPLAEFLANDPWSFIAPQVGTARVTGVQLVGGRACRILDVGGETADATVWVAPATGLPCALVATFTQKQRTPRLRAAFGNWRMGDDLPAARFTFVPPADARQIPMMPLSDGGD